MFYFLIHIRMLKDEKKFICASLKIILSITSITNSIVWQTFYRAFLLFICWLALICISLIPFVQAYKSASGEGNGDPLQYSCLGNPMDGGTWQAIVAWSHEELDVTERPNKNNKSARISSVAPSCYLQKSASTPNIYF